ncbi:element excision factor XisH family protein [Cyanothece sp. BG0011]|uniref:element excision factor XisH family protein n=1 Tax=Cyanothece sp. BG0011 TaxID=2082950 RepID=UPI0018E59E61
MLKESEPDRTLYLGIPDDNYNSLFQTRFVQKIIIDYQLRLIIYQPIEEVIKQWIS